MLSMLLLVKLVLHPLHDLFLYLGFEEGILDFLKHFDYFLIVLLTVVVADNEVWNVEK
jgi:hypothetical protein